ncbi:hypothetical protein AB0C12_02480 [Actinoplanes sp. NPDC048967]|uniref:hypothetical protein n=1 Tax=Actinoplanes sp. NPDC048967 TaxID=3155269 RepID=UPI0033C6A5B5
MAASLCLAAATTLDPALVPAIARWHDHPHDLTRWSAAMALVCLSDEPDPDLARELADLVGRPGSADEADAWPMHPTPRDGAIRALSTLVPGSIPGLPQLLAEPFYQYGADPRLLALLLSAVFPDGPPAEGTTAAELTELQRDLIGFIVDGGILDDEGFGPWHRVIAECNLPAGQAALARFVGRKPGGR